MKLEFADGRTVEVNTREQIGKELDSLNEENDFAILGNDDNFIQASYYNGNFSFQYRDGSGMYEGTRTDLNSAEAKNIFSLYLEGNPEWKNFFQWNKISDSENQNHGMGTSGYGSDTYSGSGDIKDELIRAAKKSVINWIKKKIR